MAHVRTSHSKNGDAFYRACWYIETGTRRIMRSKSFPRYLDAKHHAEKMAVEIEQRGVGDPERHDVSRYLKRYMATLRQNGELSPQTIVGYGNQVRRISDQIGNIQLSDLTAAHIDEAYARMLSSGLAPGTVRATHSVLKNALNRARKWKLIPTNPALDATAPKARQKPVRALTRDEAALVMAEADRKRRPDAYPGLDCIVHLLAGTGLRRGEVLGLSFDDIDLDELTISIRRVVIYDEHRQAVIRDQGKTNAARRTISITPDLADRLRRHRAIILEQKLAWGREYAPGPVLCFPLIGGAPMPPQALADKLRNLLARVGIEGVQPLHVFRHTQASWLMKSKMNPKAVSKRLGHRNVAFTLATYTHPTMEEDQAAAALMGDLLKQ